MALYLIDKPFGENGLTLAALDDEAAILLLQDGVYLSGSVPDGKVVYAIEEDVEKRGLGGRLPASIQPISYAQAVDLIVENKVVNFA